MASDSSVPSGLRVGFIGAGRMAQALSKGFISSDMVSCEHILASDVDTSMLRYIAECGVCTSASNVEVVQKSDVIIIAVKPHVVMSILEEVASSAEGKLFISIAAGISIATLEHSLPASSRVIRVMPNTPALIQCGASVYSLGSCASVEDGDLVRKLFSSIGICETLPESHLDAVTGLSGSGPAYGFLAIEALADGGVKMGLPRQLAQKFAAQTLLGAAKMVLETGKHPGELKDAVCSPGGTTITAVHQLESAHFRAALMNAVEAGTLKSRALSGKL